MESSGCYLDGLSCFFLDSIGAFRGRIPILCSPGDCGDNHEGRVLAAQLSKHPIRRYEVGLDSQPGLSVFISVLRSLLSACPKRHAVFCLRVSDLAASDRPIDYGPEGMWELSI